MRRAYRYRIYPDPEQRNQFAKTFGCCRFIYNRMLSDKKDWYEKHHEMLRTTPAQYKKEYEWLKEVDSLALANAQLLPGTSRNGILNRVIPPMWWATISAWRESGCACRRREK